MAAKDAIAATPFEELPPEVVALGRARFLRMSRQGLAPAYVRLSPYGPPLFSRHAVEFWLADRLTPLAPAASPALAPAWDGEPDDPRHGVAS